MLTEFDKSIKIICAFFFVSSIHLKWLCAMKKWHAMPCNLQLVNFRQLKGKNDEVSYRINALCAVDHESNGKLKSTLRYNHLSEDKF